MDIVSNCHFVTDVFPGPSCGGGIYVDGVESGEIASPNFPEMNYDNDLFCTWEFYTEEGKHVRLTFTYFSTEADTDYVKVSSLTIPY